MQCSMYQVEFTAKLPNGHEPIYNYHCLYLCDIHILNTCIPSSILAYNKRSRLVADLFCIVKGYLVHIKLTKYIVI